MIRAFKSLFTTTLTRQDIGLAAPPAAQQYDIRDPWHPANIGWRRQDAGQGDRRVRYVVAVPIGSSADEAVRRYFDVWPHSRPRRAPSRTVR